MSGQKARTEKTLDPRDELVIAFEAMLKTQAGQNVLRLIRALYGESIGEVVGPTADYVQATMQSAMREAASNLLVLSPSRRKKLKWPNIPSALALECWGAVKLEMIAGISQKEAAKRVALQRYAPARLSRRSQKLVELKIATDTILDYYKAVELARKQNPGLAALMDNPYISNLLIHIAKAASKP